MTQPSQEGPCGPHDIQRAALEALARSRSEGHQRALVVLATGLGKTLLSALDVAAFTATRPEQRRPRVLFLAHRAELLKQAAATFQRQLAGSSVGWFIAEQSQLSGDLIFASVQKLSRPEGLARLGEQSFDYVIVDEVHHAAAASYRAILARLRPEFLLGLTATPERADDGDVLGLFDDHLAFRADLGEGIERGLLVPFEYHGLKDDVAYTNIPWRNHRFDPAMLAQAVQTEARMQRMWAAWGDHPATRTLVFCCSVAHATYVKQWLREKDVRVFAVHSEPGTDDREEALRKLASGELDAVCTVDLFNEGVDVPSVDRVVMLRPTESSIVFLQQLGRGLRRAQGKAGVKVIDFVGNHRMFLERMRTLMALTKSSERSSLRDFIVDGTRLELPPGCSLDVELEAKQLLAELLPGGQDELEQVYRERRATWGRRPTAIEMYRLGYSPSLLRARRGRGWMRFVQSEGDLSEPGHRAMEAGARWFDELETTAMSKSFKMVLLEALLDAGMPPEGLSLRELAERSLAILRRTPELKRDIEGVRELTGPRDTEAKRFLTYWKKNPVQAWTGGDWFQVEEDRFVPRLPLEPDTREAFLEMTRELVDYRLAQYRARGRAALATAFETAIHGEEDQPVLELAAGNPPPSLLEGELEVHLPDGSPWSFFFTASTCALARPTGTKANALPALLRQWFSLGRGTSDLTSRVRFTPGPDGWWAAPLQVRSPPTLQRRMIVSFPSLRAAAGARNQSLAWEGAPEAAWVSLPIQTREEGVFAVRASGDSMDGGAHPIRDGDWLVMRYVQSPGLGATEGQVALVQLPERSGHGYHVKRIKHAQGRWSLHSDNPSRPSLDALEGTLVLASLVDVIPPERLGPTVGEPLTDEQASQLFGFDTPPRTGRWRGHLVLCIQDREVLTDPDRLEQRIADLQPAETAFVLTRAENGWRYAGVARWLEDEDRWALADPVDFATWRALGHGRQSSRRLPPGALERASDQAKELLITFPPGEVIERTDNEGKLKRCRIVGLSREGGIRIDGGEGGFKERTVSQVDLAWALLALDDTRLSGGELDEKRVNRLRYLEGTPRESTRWIDTGWALHLLGAHEKP